MARRYSNREKKKWISDPSRPPKRAPIQIPEEDCSNLIEEHKYTLIGRVTNSAMQNTRALVDFFLQHWQVIGTITGKSLGPLLFQFTFDSEKDLQSILSKAPYHLKKWMFILQRWEPIVSDLFPATIPTIHGVPLHYWTYTALRAIGNELGPVETTDANRCRVRVIINGLKPLERTLEISLSSGVKKVELEYEKLEKHCFSCLSLSHEEGNCPTRAITTDSSSQRLGISQMRTLDRIAESRKRADNRKLSRFSPYERGYGAPNNNDRRPEHYSRERYRSNNDHLLNAHEERRDGRREGNSHSCNISSSEDRDRDRSYSQRPTNDKLPPIRESSYVSIRSQGMRSANPSAKSYWRPVSGDGAGGHSNSVQSQVSHTPSPKTQREPMIMDRTRSLTSPQTPRDSVASVERRSALERISGVPDRVPLLHNGVANSDSGRLQEVNIQYLEDAPPYQTPPELMRPSGSRTTGLGSAQNQRGGNESPIRTLSEDRAHVSLRLGPLPPDDSPLPILAKTTSKSAGKKPTRPPSTRAPTTRRVIRSPVQASESEQPRPDPNLPSTSRSSPI
ncbi:hypothetical protein HID58_037263 [Brassica napus]|uniref:DUF4283 domain-containing protein n=1 Tax=Brassica napus TaxID=3708 RepID=A0ABQ8BMJ5_BRANA|nr:hypothetical protein HID58_037263 [Brassica napus]